MAKPGDFYVGVLSFFAVILPGMIGVAIFEPILGPYLRESILVLRSDDIVARWALFLVVAYFVGHIIFMLGDLRRTATLARDGGVPVAHLPCAMRYYERRLKSTTQTYIYIVALHRIGKLQGSSSAQSKTPDLIRDRAFVL